MSTIDLGQIKRKNPIGTIIHEVPSNQTIGTAVLLPENITKNTNNIDIYVPALKKLKMDFNVDIELAKLQKDNVELINKILAFKDKLIHSNKNDIDTGNLNSNYNEANETLAQVLFRIINLLKGDNKIIENQLKIQLELSLVNLQAMNSLNQSALDALEKAQKEQIQSAWIQLGGAITGLVINAISIGVTAKTYLKQSTLSAYNKSQAHTKELQVLTNTQKTKFKPYEEITTPDVSLNEKDNFYLEHINKQQENLNKLKQYVENDSGLKVKNTLNDFNKSQRNILKSINTKKDDFAKLEILVDTPITLSDGAKTQLNTLNENGNITLFKKSHDNTISLLIKNPDEAQSDSYCILNIKASTQTQNEYEFNITPIGKEYSTEIGTFYNQKFTYDLIKSKKIVDEINTFDSLNAQGEVNIFTSDQCKNIFSEMQEKYTTVINTYKIAQSRYNDLKLYSDLLKEYEEHPEISVYMKNLQLELNQLQSVNQQMLQVTEVFINLIKTGMNIQTIKLDSSADIDRRLADVLIQTFMAQFQTTADTVKALLDHLRDFLQSVDATTAKILEIIASLAVTRN